MFLRLFFLVAFPLLFWAAWHATPELIGKEAILWLIGIMVLFAGLEAYLFQKVTDLHAVNGLDTKERDYLRMKITDAKRRIYYMCAVGLVAILVLWALAMLGLPVQSPAYAAAAGFLVGICLSYIALAPFWLSEIHDFVANAHDRVVDRQRRAEELAKLGA